MTYTFYWRTGQREIYSGNSPADALNGAGYGYGALAALDFYMPGDDHAYEYINHKWISKQIQHINNWG